MTVPTITNSISRSPLRRVFLLIPLTLALFALAPTAGAAGKGPPTNSGVPNGMQEFTTVGNNGFVVPTGVTKLLVEVWGAGGVPAQILFVVLEAGAEPVLTRGQ